MHFDIQVGETYWTKGFLNVPVDFDRFIMAADGRFNIYLGNSTSQSLGGPVVRQTGMPRQESTATGR